MSASPLHEYRITRVGARLEIWQRGALDSAAATKFVEAIERAIADEGVDNLLFDNRETTAPDDAVREQIVGWVRGVIRSCFVAVVLESDLLAVRFNMEALAHRTRHRAFGTIADAARWLDAKSRT